MGEQIRVYVLLRRVYREHGMVRSRRETWGDAGFTVRIGGV